MYLEEQGSVLDYL